MSVCMIQVQVYIYRVSTIYCNIVIGHNVHYGGCASYSHSVALGALKAHFHYSSSLIASPIKFHQDV